MDLLNSRNCEDGEIEETNGVNPRILELLKNWNPNNSGSIQKSSKNSTSLASDLETESKSSSSSTKKEYCDYQYFNRKTAEDTNSRVKFLPPIGVFWDIENCQVPKGRSALAVTQIIREKFFSGYKEAEFIVVCDVQKENKQIVQELNDAQVNLIHVSATCKNAADEKLRQSIRRFADIHGSPAAVILISGDINFAADLTDLRYRKKIHVILLHKENTSEALIVCANEHYDFMQLTDSLPSRTPGKVAETFDLLICNLPEDKDILGIKRRLKQLSNNCGGRVIEIQADAAIVRFASKESADRAKKRMDGEFVFSSKITVQCIEDKETNCEDNQGFSVRKHTLSESEVAESPKSLCPNSSAEARSLPVTPLYCQSSPSIGNNFPLNGCNSSGRRLFPSNEMNLSKNSADNSFAQNLLPETPRNSSQKTRDNLSLIRHPEWQSRHSRQNFSPKIGDGLQNNLKQQNPSPMYSHQQNNDQRHWNNREDQYWETQVRNDSRSPSPCDISSKSQSVRNSQIANEKDESFFKTMENSNGKTHNSSSETIVLKVTNLDENINVTDMQRILTSLFMEHVMVLNLSAFVESDANHAAYVKLLTLHEAKYAISKLHNRQVGYKKIQISLVHQNSPAPILETSQSGKISEPSFCTIHTQKQSSDQNCAEQESVMLPSVKISLEILQTRVDQLLKSHNGSLALTSFEDCYNAQFKEPLMVDEKGVPLEHLISCLPTIEMKPSPKGGKYLTTKIEKSSGESNEGNPPLTNQLAIFSRELVDLLKNFSRCQLPLNRFMQTYHQHFGKQCKVADFGFTKLIDLLEVLTHVIQVMGEGNKSVITLSHQAQVRRFTSNLLRILKTQADKQIVISELPSFYQRVLGKPLDIVDYGVCQVEDILKYIPKNIVIITYNNDKSDRIIRLPRKEQTPEEIAHTHKFAIQVVQILRRTPYHKIMLNKFVPVYQQHCGHQCRVSDFGFTKLVELFESISEFVQVEESPNGERCISLSNKEKFRLLGEQFMRMLHWGKGSLNVSKVEPLFFQMFGYHLKPEIFGCGSVLHLVENLGNFVKLVHTESGNYIIPIDNSHLLLLSLQCRRTLLGQPNHRSRIESFHKLYIRYYNAKCDLEEIRKKLPNIVTFFVTTSGSFVELRPMQKFACNLYKVLMNYRGSIDLSQFEKAYLTVTGVHCKYSELGFPNVAALLRCLPCTVVLKETDSKCIVQLNKQLAIAGFPLPFNFLYRNPEIDSKNESFIPSSSHGQNSKSEEKMSNVSENQKLIPRTQNKLNFSSKNGTASNCRVNSSLVNFSKSEKINTESKKFPASKVAVDSGKVENSSEAGKNAYFSLGKRIVIAPHPSELPLPNMPSKFKSSDDCTDLPNFSCTKHSNFSGNNEQFCDCEVDSFNKHIPGNKRRLAAQFVQTIDS